MSTKRIRLESMPKGAPRGAGGNRQEWTVPADNVEQGRDIVARIRAKHDKESKWYKIYIDDQLVFNSELIKR